MNNQINEIKDLLLVAEGDMIAASIYYESDKRRALSKMIAVEAQLQKVRNQVTQFLETNHYPEN